MSSKLKEKNTAQAQKEPCRHFWVIESANGPMSRGKCKYCGVKKEFYNAFPEFNPLRKGNNPFNMPRLNEVKVENNRKS